MNKTQSLIITADYRKGPTGYVASICPLVGAVKRLLASPSEGEQA